MVDKKQHEDPEEVIQSAIGRTEMFIMKNGRLLLTVLGVVVLVVLGFFAYKHLYAAPQQKKAAEAMFEAQNFFAADSFALALHGDGNSQGFLAIAEKYGSTESGNLAKHYAGQSYLRMGDYRNAIKYFSQYRNVSGLAAGIINAMNAGQKGDAHIQLGEIEKGANLYAEAVSLSDNSLSAPYYARKAGMVYQKLGQNAKALEMYRIVKDKYPQSMEAGDIDKFIAQVLQ